MLVSQRESASVFIQVGLLSAVAVALRATNLDQAPSFDELYHILAARSWAIEGTLRIADGEYNRAALYTMGLGVLFDWFGESLSIARLPSLVAGVFSVVGLFLWTRWVGGGLAGWIAALLLCFSPLAIDVSQFIRFYALHGLFFLLGASGAYALLTRPLSKVKMAALAAASVLALACAYYLQRLTLVGVAGLAFWVVILLASSWWRAWSMPRLRLPLVIVHALALVALAGIFWGGVAERYLEEYQTSLPWFPDPDVRYYYWRLVDQHPTLWTLLPLAAIIALARRTEPALYCLCVFAVTFVLLSFAGTQADRYIYFVLPHLFALIGIAIAELVPIIRGVTSAAIERTVGLGRNTAISKALTRACLAGFAVYVFVFTPAILTTLKMVAAPSGDAGPDWKAAKETLAPLLARDPILVVSTSGLRALYYLGRYELEYSPTHVKETDTGQDFGMDGNTGRRVIATAEALRRVLECHPAGFLIDDFPQGSPYGLDREAESILEHSAKQLILPESYRLRVYVWEHSAPTANIDCSVVLSWMPIEGRPTT